MSLTAPACPPDLARAYGDEAARRLGRLFLDNAVQAGLRLTDGNKYRPGLPQTRSSALLRAELRRALPPFLAFLHACPETSEVSADALAETGRDARLWFDPLPSARWAAALLPGDFDAELTLAVNVLRRGQAAPALARFHGGLQRPPLRPEPRAQLLRNAAAAYELLGDDAGARWCAERAYENCPWDGAALASYLIYLTLEPDAADRAETVRSACRGFRGRLRRPQMWGLLSQRGGRASRRLQRDSTLRRRFHEAIHTA